MADGERATADQSPDETRVEVGFGPTLVPADIEAALERLGLGPDRERGRTGRSWVDRVGPGPVRFDLAGVEAPELTALAHLVVLVEGLVRHGRRVEVVVPVPRMVEPELRRLDERPELAPALRAQVAVRSAARQFLGRSGFEEAVRCTHVPEAARLVTIVDGEARLPSPPERPVEAGATAAAAGLDPAPVPVLPLQWLPQWSSDEHRTAWEREAAEALGRTTPGLTFGEGRALSELLVRELVDNVHTHADDDRSRPASMAATTTPAALVGAALVHRPGARTFPVGTIAGPGVPVLRLVVGDSGAGLATTRSEWFASRSGTAANTTWQRHGDENPGLSNVRRLVRESCGSLLIRSGDKLGGVLFPGGERQTVTKADCAWSPGTFVDVAVPPRSALAAAADLLDRDEKGERTTPAALVVLPLTEDGRSIDVEAALRAVDDRLSAEPSDFLVAALPPVEMAGTTAEQVFDQISLLAEVVAGDVGLVVMAAAASGSQLFPLAQAYDEGRSRDLDAEPTPVMLRDEQGRTAWLGAGSLTSRLLALLTAEEDHRPTIDEAAARLSTSPTVIAQAAHTLRLWVETDIELEIPGAVADPTEVAGGATTIGLRLTPAAIDGALPQLLRGQLDVALTLPAVARHGAFVTPTLERLSMWVDGAQLIEAMGGSHLVGHTLAALVRSRHPDLDLSDGQLVRLGTHLPVDFARAFGDSLGLSPKLYRVSGEAGFVDDPELLPVSRDTPVVLLTDVMVSGNTVRGAVVDMIRHGARPRLVVALVDYGRAGETERFLEPSPELVTLATVDNPAPPTDAVPAVIDPLRSRQGLDYVPPALTYRLDRDDLLRWCGECRASILTGHIARLARRHFSTFLNSAALLRTGSHSAEAIAAAMADEIVAHLPDRFHRVELWYPGSAIDVAGSLAHLVGARLSPGPGHGTGAAPASASASVSAPASMVEGKDVRLVGVERVLTGGRWVFPLPAEPVEAETHVVVVDWGSVTTRTLNDLVGRAADAGAASVHAVVFASQLSPEDEAAERRVRFLGRQPRAGFVPGPRDAATLPARVSFVSSFSTGYDSAAACRLCRLVDEYEREAIAAPAPELREHAARMAALLEPTALHDAQARGPRDLFGQDLTPAEAAGILRWRQDLNATLTDTGQRWALLGRLQTLSPDGQHELVALVRLLVLEPRWLKLPPLRITSVRDVLSESVAEVVRSGRFDQLPVTVQRQLVIVLRMADKGFFLDQLPDLVDPRRRVALPSEAVTEVLFAAYTIIDRGYHHQRPIMASARAALSEALRRAELASGSGDAGAAATAAIVTSILTRGEQR